MKKKVLALLTVLVMVLSIVAVPNVSANADEAKGEINFANGYDWTNQSTQFYAFASADETATAGSITGQGVGFMGWFSGVVLELNEDYNYVVKLVAPADGTNEAEAETLGAGKVAIIWHSDAATAHPETAAFFASLQVGDVLTPSTYWENIAGASGAQTALSFTKAAEGSKGPKAPTKGALNVVNGYGRMVEEAGVAAALDICVLSVNDATLDVATVTQGALNWWCSMVLEKDATKGTWVVKVADLNPTDGVCDCASEKLGENKLVVAIHGGVEDKESASFFLGTARVGQEYYLIGELPAANLSQAGTALTGVYLSTEKPADPEPTPTPNPDEPGDDITPTGDFDTMATTALMMVSVALVGVVLVLKKRNNVA
ncbi:MAG: hypothetical protein J6B96_02300 [Agathobacter sp.]|nr:hypothetical protein [Agathobacter sp.]